MSFRTPDGWTIVALYQAPRKGKPVAVMVHGVGAGKGEWDDFSRELWGLGFGTLAIDLRGHGESTRGPQGSEGYASFDAAGEWPRAQADIESAVGFLNARGISSPRIGIVGGSIGANLASRAAQKLRLPWAVSPLSRTQLPRRLTRAPLGRRRFHKAGPRRLSCLTPTRELQPGLSYANVTIDPPSARFSYRVCVDALWTSSMGPHTLHTVGCPRTEDFSQGVGTLPGYGGEGEGSPVAAYPSSQAIAAATSFLATRAGRTSFAVIDSTGHLSGVRVHDHFQTASVVKVMMLVAYLRKLSDEHRGLSSSDTGLLYPMIHISDNEAASAVFAKVGAAALADLARLVGMADYAPAAGWWAYTQTSAADQARFFLSLDELIPTQFYAYARSLLSGIEPSQSWGVPPVARPQWRVFFKTGALPSEGLFNEVARLERGAVTFTIAVFTDGDPSMSYGEQTIQGVAAALLADTPPG